MDMMRCMIHGYDNKCGTMNNMMNKVRCMGCSMYKNDQDQNKHVLP